MSTDSNVAKQDQQHGDQALNIPRPAEGETTPRFEAPISVKVMTPSLSEETATVTDYFARNPAGVETSSHAPSSPTTVRRSPSIASTNEHANGSIIAPEGITSPTLERPLPAREASTMTAKSMESTDSSVTVTANGLGQTSSRQSRPRPAYPNQAFAVLQDYQYPIRGPPPTIRQRTTHPAQVLTFSSALASLHQSGSRTAGNSPAATPGNGLFVPSAPASAPEDWASPETPGTYASPFLHFTHRQAPKETHVADVDVDPISGRKLINHYEIIDELGRGTHGKVKLGRDLNTATTHVAIKIVERYSKRRRLGKLGNAEDKVKKEVAILKKARHPNVVALLEVIDDPSRKKVYIVLEWVERGEIHWREKAPKEIAMVEARRYEREKREIRDGKRDAEDEAVVAEAQKRMRRRKRAILRAYRKMREKTSDDPRAFSLEMQGDEESGDEEDDRLSRVSTATAESALPEATIQKLMSSSAAGPRRGSRAPSPLPSIPQKQEVGSFLTLTDERRTEEPDPMVPTTPVDSNGNVIEGLRGTMYGPYDPSSAGNSRKASIANSVRSNSSRSQHSGDDLLQVAAEILDSDLNPELEYVPCMTLQNVRVAFRDTLLGLQYLHYQGIVHRDIKPPNLLQTIEHRVKISDFGVSYLGRPLHDEEAGEEVSESEARDLDDEAKELAKTVGTPAFFAPELCITDPSDDPLPVTKAIDVWALGITLFCMLYARTPYVDNEFVVMRMIADEEIYIPRRRLQPINQKTQSRPSSHSRIFPIPNAGRRSEFDIVYEDIDDDLYDLLKRLLTKDPRKRITLEEVRHHPWVVADLPNKLKWLEETDPNRQSQGKKIEVSNEDVNTAVVPLQWVDRVRSGIKRVGERLGFGSSSRSGRGRSGSSAGAAPGQSAPASANSSSSTISQDARRQSLRGDESIFSALKASREGEHPLSKSVAATPESEKQSAGFFDSRVPRPESTAPTVDRPSPVRPSPPERSKTVTSTAGSMRTIKQSDLRGHLREESPPPSPGLPGTPMALESPGGSALGGLVGGSARRIFKSLRERSTARSTASDVRGRSTDRGSVESLDPHGGPSVAVSQAVAAGHVNPPEALRDMAPRSTSAAGSARNSPSSSRAGSIVSMSPRGLRPSAPPALSRKSSTNSLASTSRLSTLAEETPSRKHTRGAPQEFADENWDRVQDERVRRLIREDDEANEIRSRPTSAFDDRTCPPSPDDDARRRAEARFKQPNGVSQPTSSLETSPTSHAAQIPPSLVSSTSDFGSAVSMSVSNPSIPSVISEASSLDPAEGEPLEAMDSKRNIHSDDTLNPKPAFRMNLAEEEAGYSPDQEEVALDSDDEEYDSSSDSDGGLVMSRRRSAGRQMFSSSPRNGGLAAALEAAHEKQRRGTGLSKGSKRSSRSGSNNTMKKVRTRDSEDDRVRQDIEEE